MCGIAGYFGNKQIDKCNIETCLNLMKRRGPDSSGIYNYQFINKRYITLLHTRLSIIDLDPRSNQPLKIGSKILVFNGELYNYLELKKELISLGYRFRTHSDTEVFLIVLTEFGWKGLYKCEGMWAFALYDESDGSITLSRDRFGEKPVYLYRTSNGIYFASEIKFIFALKGKKADVNMNHIFRYMINGYKSLYKEKETFYKGIEELSSASILQIDHCGVEKMFKYWHFSSKQDESLSYHDAVEFTKEKLIKSVELRLRADVPLAFCMSGGIDSNSLICIAKKIFDYDVHGFTINNDDFRYDEHEMVRHVVKKFNIRHTMVHGNKKNFITNLSTLINQHDSPIYTISYYLHWLLMENISERGYKISVSGTAADELFSGYYDHHNAYLYEMSKIDKKLYYKSLKLWHRYIKPIVRNPFLKNPGVFIDNPNQRGHIYLDADKFSSYLLNTWSESFKEKKYCCDLLRNRMLNELLEETVPIILHEDDLNAMYFSIENRSPFLDKDLFELSIKIPTRYLIKNGMAKAVLRDAMRGIVPDIILNERRKIGFNASVSSFIDIYDNEQKACVLDNSPIFNIVKKEKIEQLFNKPVLLNSQSKFLFNFINVKLFLYSL